MVSSIRSIPVDTVDVWLQRKSNEFNNEFIFLLRGTAAVFEKTILIVLDWKLEPVGSKIFGPGPDLLSIFGPGTRTRTRLIKICQTRTRTRLIKICQTQTRTRYFFTCLTFEKFFSSVYIWWSLQKLRISSFPLICMDD